MASSGSFETTKYGGVRGLKFSWWVNSQSIDGNYTDIGYNWVGSGSGSTWYYTLNSYLNINGSRVYTQGSSKVQLSSGTVMASGTLRIYHNSDGSRSFSADGGATIYNYGTYQTGSGSWSLPTIPRTSSPTLSSSELNVGESVTVTTNRKATSLTHKLYYKLNNGSETLLSSGIGDSYTWTIPKSLANSITTTDNGTITFKLVTVSSGSDIGSSTVTMKVKVPNTSEFCPSISSVTLSEAGSVPSSWGFYVKSLSKIKGVISASGAYGSTISSYSTSFNNESFTSSTFTTSSIALTNPTIKVTVKDSRGRSATYSATVTVINYAVPTITSYSAYRSTSDSSKVQISFKCKIYSLNDKNSKSFKFYYKNSNDSSYSSIDIDTSKLTSSTSNGVITYSGTLTMITADTSASYNTYLKATDSFNEIPSSYEFISTIFRLINISADKKYFAIGKMHEKSGYNEKSVPEIHYENIYRQDGDYNGIVLSCPSITDGEINFNSSNKSIEFDVGGTTYGITIWTSDERLKKDIKEVSNSYIDKIKAIKHIEFYYKDNDIKIPIGYSANQLQEIDKSFVVETGEEKILQPNINVILPAITKTMQELIDKVEDLERKIKKYESN